MGVGYGWLDYQDGEDLIIRNATFEDFPQVLELAYKVHDFFPPHLRDHPLNDAQIQRTYVVSMFAPNGFVMVAEDDGNIVGCMVAGITENGWGLQVASDIFMFSQGGTKKLLVAYKAWAKDQGAHVINITDLCDQPGYQQVIESAGFKRAGTLFFGVD